MKPQEKIESNYATKFLYRSYLRMFYRQAILALTKFPNLIVAVFLRRKLGERYFTMAASVTFAVILYTPYQYRRDLRHISEIFDYLNFTWVIFILLFLMQSIFRRLEFKRSSKIIRGDIYSYFEGETLNPLWDWVERKTKFIKNDATKVERYYEPLLVFLVGVVLIFTYFAVFVGLFLILLAFFHYLRVAVLYAQGKDFLMDEVDKLIISKNLKETILDNKPASETQGFRIPGGRPEKQVSQAIINRIYGSDTEDTVLIE
ncbi:hypothetical protein [uncultured Draconibacterium sp.]|uniref:hypothetical protein n=1 Tax=uncultured Draconibacterium sp. TaxID=1573823 RepID=UPI0029C93D2C|nr:hypothetical protein [uncultured Draconibacterium sp.]